MRASFSVTAVLSLLAIISIRQASADIIIEPPAPDSESAFTVTIGGGWRDSCVPKQAQTDISSGKIVLTIDTLLGSHVGGCLAAVSGWRVSVRVGPIPPGAYQLQVFIKDDDRSFLWEETRVVVSDGAASFWVYPMAAAVGSAEKIQLIAKPDTPPLVTCSSVDCPLPVVTVGPDRARVEKEVVGNLIITPPSLPVGVYDVTVEDVPGNARTVKTGFRVYDPGAPLDRSLFDTVLFPVTYSGSGSFGSRWQTEILVRNPSPVPHLTFGTPPLAGASTTPMTATLPNDDRGILFHPLRPFAEHLQYAAFVRDISRQDDRWGTELPIVRDADFRGDEVDFVTVPIDRRYRTALRMYALGNDPVPFRVIIHTAKDNRYQVGVDVQGSRPAPGRPSFASIANLSSLLNRVADGERIRVTVWAGGASRIVRAWAMISVTNNETQHVTIITPQ